MAEHNNCASYDSIARQFADAHRHGWWQDKYFDMLTENTIEGGRVLDCGCGAGHPAIDRLLKAGLRLVALDGAAEMLKLFRERFGSLTTVHCDMRLYEPDQPFDAIIAWDSFFHLNHADQKAMLGKFSHWLKPGGHLLFSTGPEHSALEGEMFGQPFSYASFTPEEYRSALAATGFDVVLCELDEPGGDRHMAWLARRRPSG